MSVHNPSPVMLDDSTILLTMVNNCWGCKHNALYSVKGALQHAAAGADGGSPQIMWEENATDMTKVRPCNHRQGIVT